MRDEFDSYKTWIVVKKIVTALFWMYVVVVISSSETHLPSIKSFVCFYTKLFDFLFISNTNI